MRPEQERALAYLDRKGTQAPIDVVSSAVASTFEKMEARLASLSELPTHERPAPDKWSLIEIVDHLIESHRPAAGQIEAALRGEDPGEAIPAGLQSAEPRAMDWAECVSALEATHAAFLEALARGRDSDSASPIPVAMVIRVADPDGSARPLEWIEPLHWKAYAIAVKVHTLEHLAQIERVVGALSPEAASS